MGAVTHLLTRSDALRNVQGEAVEGQSIRACAGCGTHFSPTRFWQKQCSARCRQRAYVARQVIVPVGYYGA